MMTGFVKVIIVLLFVFIMISLGSALYFLLMDKGSSDRIVKALTWRIAISIVLFILLMFAFAMGWITPHGV